MHSMSLLIKPASSLCNMKCKYCFYSDVANERQVQNYGMMSERTIENIIKKALACVEHEITFAFQGGEPTLAGLPFYKRVLELQNRHKTSNIKIHNAIQTNGYKIDDKWASFFAENGFLVGLSMDGYKETHDALRVDTKGKGTFNRVERTAKLFDRYGVEYNILCVVNNFVARHPAKTYGFLKKYKYLQFIPCIDNFEGEKNIYSLTEDRYAEFLKITFNEYYKDIVNDQYTSVRNFDNYINILMGGAPENCAMSGICNCYFAIEGDGSVFPCDFYMVDEWKLGNINSESFENMINSDVARRFVNVSRHVDEKCKNCLYFSLCRGGCRRDREPLNDGRLSLNKYCNAYEAFFSYSINKMQEIKVLLKNGVI